MGEENDFQSAIKGLIDQYGLKPAYRSHLIRRNGNGQILAMPEDFAGRRIQIYRPQPIGDRLVFIGVETPDASSPARLRAENDKLRAENEQQKALLRLYEEHGLACIATQADKPAKDSEQASSACMPAKQEQTES